jgi:hypothetical protein
MVSDDAFVRSGALVSEILQIGARLLDCLDRSVCTGSSSAYASSI